MPPQDADNISKFIGNVTEDVWVGQKIKEYDVIT